MVKVERLADGRIVGISGNAGHGRAFIRWLVEAGPKPKLGQFKALVLDLSGLVTWYNKDLEALRSETPAAIGSGMDHALSAMDAGCSPHRAVELAALRDPNTGGQITVLHLETALREVA